MFASRLKMTAETSLGGDYNEKSACEDSDPRRPILLKRFFLFDLFCVNDLACSRESES